MTEVLDEELAVGLRQAKKKPRNFVLVVKGAKALKLLVSKKPIKAGEVQAAKAEVKGTGVYKGVCHGDGGVEMVFRLVGEEPSVKAVQFKDLIAELTELTVKPRFELVSELAEINEDEEGEGQPAGANAAKPAANAPIPPAAPAVPPAPPAPNPLEQQVRQGWTKVLPLCEQALASPAVAEPAKAQIRELRKRLEAGVAGGKWKEAAATMAQMIPLVKPASGGGSQPASAAASQDWQRAKEAWEEAMQQAGEQISRLAALLADAEAEDLPKALLEDLQAIGRFGLPALTKNFRTPLVAAILDVERAAPDMRAALAAAGSSRVKEFLKHLTGDPAIAAVDRNPFGASVSLQATLEPPLAALGRAFDAFAAGNS